MIRYSLGTALAASLLALQTGSAFAQNTTDPGTTNPPTGSDRPSTTTPRSPSTNPPAGSAAPAPAPPPAPPSEPRTNTEVVPVPIVVPQQQAAPPATVTLPAEPYPNGFADPTVPYGNDMSVAVREEGGFDWGLLGLLGLLGLFGLYRPRDRYSRTVHSERYDDGRRPVRERVVDRDPDL
jgi:hypothetical protein